jgi:hypothetical protein
MPTHQVWEERFYSELVKADFVRAQGAVYEDYEMNRVKTWHLGRPSREDESPRYP